MTIRHYVVCYDGAVNTHYASYRSAWRKVLHGRPVLACWLCWLLVACSGTEPAPQILPTITPQPFTPLAAVIARAPRSNQAITTAGYIYANPDGVRLIDGAGLNAKLQPQPLAPATQQVWLGAKPAGAVEQMLRRAASTQLVPVVARGTLVGPGQFGPQGRYSYQLNDPQFDVLVPQDTTLTLLLAHSNSFEHRLVRVVGTLFAQGNAGLLVEKAEVSGMPTPGTVQIKLAGPLRDQTMIGRLQQARDKQVHFGRVQIEGFWIGGALLPQMIIPTTFPSSP